MRVRRPVLAAAVLVLVTAFTPVPASAATPPSQVQALFVARGDGYLTATWEAPDDAGGSPVVAYSVIAVKPSGRVAAWTNLLPDATSASVAPLVNGVIHRVHVVAWTSAGASTATVTKTPSASAPASTPPPFPRDLQVTFASGCCLGPTATWTAPESDGGSPIVAYSMVTQYGRPPFLVTRWTHVGPNDRQATCADCDANVVWLIPWNANGAGQPASVGQFPF